MNKGKISSKQNKIEKINPNSSEENLRSSDCEEMIEQHLIIMDYIKPDSLSMEGNLAVNFDLFLKDFNIYMEATEKTKKSVKCQKANFLNYIGSEARQKYYSWDIASDDTATLESVIEAFRKYCNPKKNKIYERMKFYKRVQKIGEPFDNFLKDLRVLSDGCEFNDEKDNMVRDFIILGLNNKEIGDKLMNTVDLTLDSTINTCRVAELEVSRIKEVHEAFPTEVSMLNRKHFNKSLNLSVNKNNPIDLKKNTNYNFPKTNFSFNGPMINCDRCLSLHARNKCPAFGKICKICKKPNHFYLACSKFNIQKTNYNYRTNEITKNQKPEECDSDTETEDLSGIDEMKTFYIDHLGNVDIKSKNRSNS